MRALTEDELNQVVGGATISGSLVTAIVKAVNIFTDLGRYFGGSIRRMFENKYCPIK